MILVCATAHPGRPAPGSSDERLALTLGESHYSYQFVLEQFLPVLEELDTVVRVDRPDEEVDAIFGLCEQLGQPCVFLSFAPPQLTPLHLRCRTIPVFAWEFPDIPTEAWSSDPRDDWQHVFGEVGSAITHSRFAAEAVRRVMGDGFSILFCPSPVWDRFQPAGPPGEPLAASILPVPSGAFAIDTGDLRGAESFPVGLSASLSLDIEELLRDGDQAKGTPPPLRLEGVVYTSVFNPADFRKNWQRMVISFCRAFRQTSDAVLLLKFVHWNHGYYLSLLRSLLCKLAPFRCRIVGIGGFLETAAYDAMVRATTYAINASTGEGQCLPLMEFMSGGKPAVTPRHTAMLDYVDEEDAFLVEGFPQETGFPQDPRAKILTTSFQFESDSMIRALLESYATAREHPDRYRRLSENAVARLREHCSRRTARERLRRFLSLPEVPA